MQMYHFIVVQIFWIDTGAQYQTRQGMTMRQFSLLLLQNKALKNMCYILFYDIWRFSLILASVFIHFFRQKYIGDENMEYLHINLTYDQTFIFHIRKNNLQKTIDDLYCLVRYFCSIFVFKVRCFEFPRYERETHFTFKSNLFYFTLNLKPT